MEEWAVQSAFIKNVKLKQLERVLESFKRTKSTGKGERDDFFVLLMQNEKVRTGSKPDDKFLYENPV